MGLYKRGMKLTALLALDTGLALSLMRQLSFGFELLFFLELGVQRASLAYCSCQVVDKNAQPRV